jgi:uncharacterized protein YndB with AHSA1/START domain
MKTLIIIGAVLAAVIVILAILAALAPKSIHTQSRVVINKPIEEVFLTTRYLKNFDQWSPWKDTDPEQKTRVEGVDGQVGASFHWQGVKEKSKGYQEIVSLVPNKSIGIACHITEPFASQPTFNFSFTEENGKTIVLNDFDTKMPIPFNVVGMLMGLKKEIKATNDRGLEKLKALCEKN